MKKSIFDEQTSKALKQWHRSALKKKNEGGKPDPMPMRTLGGGGGGGSGSPPESPSEGSHEFQHHSDSLRPPNDVEASAVPSANIIATVDLQQQQNYSNRDLLS